MLASVVCAVLCGHRSYAAIVPWLHLQPVAIWHKLGFTRTPPQSTCFETLLSRLEPGVLGAALSRWIRDGLGLSLEELQAVSLDGKTLRGTLCEHQQAIHLLAALDHKLGCVLSQTAVDGKTNEHKAALELLEGLVLEGRVIVGDALFCQHEVCQRIRDRGGRYLLRGQRKPADPVAGDCLRLRRNEGLFPPMCSGNILRNARRPRRWRSRTAGSNAVAW
jgi:Transposase DDE domain/DDE_Tnp_1-associated